MIVLDANILLYAYDSQSTLHGVAREWLEAAFSDSIPIGIAWQSLLAFVRISTDVRLPGTRLTVEQATELVESWLQQSNVRLLPATEDHWLVFQRMVTEGQARGPLVTDAHLAALTIENGAVLYTTDRDFARFPGLRWQNPLEDGRIEGKRGV